MITSDLGARSVALARASSQAVPGWTGRCVGGTCPSPPPSRGAGEERAAGSQLRILTHPGSRAAPTASYKRLQFRAATGCPPGFASGHNAWFRIGGKRPKRRKTCRSLHPGKVCRALSQRAQGFSSGKPDSDFHPQDKHIALPALCFFRPDPRKQISAASVPGAGVCCSTAAGCLPWLAPASPLPHRGRAAVPALLPHWGFNCGHAGFSTRTHSPGVTGLHREQEVRDVYKAMFKGLHGLQFGLPVVHQEVPQATSVS